MFSTDILYLTIESVSKNKKKHSHSKICAWVESAKWTVNTNKAKNYFFFIHRIVFSHSF